MKVALCLRQVLMTARLRGGMFWLSLIRPDWLIPPVYPTPAFSILEDLYVDLIIDTSGFIFLSMLSDCVNFSLMYLTWTQPRMTQFPDRGISL